MITDNPFFEVPIGFKTKFMLEKLPSTITSLQWSPGGRLLASGHANGEIHVWDSQSGVLKHRFTGLAKIIAMSWAPDELTLACSERRRGLCFWDLHTNGLRGAVEFRYEDAQKLAWSPNGKLLALLMKDNTVYVYETSTGRTKRVASSLNGIVRSLAWSRDGKTIAFGYDDGTISLSEPVSGKVLQTFSGHSGAVLGLDWSPDTEIIASSSKDRTVRLWSLFSKQCTVLEGHTTQVSSVSFSSDGRIVASRSWDGDIWFWRCDIARKILFLKESNRREDDGCLGVEFHPSRHMLTLPAESNQAIHVWDFNPSIVLNLASSDPTYRYTNAKVVLVGNSGVGKSGLGLVLSGQPFAATESTHGRHVWIFDTSEVEVADGIKETRETLLWDLAGQPGYRLIHQLHLHEVAVALIVFDLRSETDPFSGVRHWERALRQANRTESGNTIPIKKFLVAARSDRGGVGVSNARIEVLKRDLQFDMYFETSAREGWNIEQLSASINRAIEWNALPKVISTALFQRIKSFLIDEKQNKRLLSSVTDLYRTLLKMNAELEDTGELFAQFDTCIGRVESRGLIRRLSFGSLVLLQPELLDAYASAIVNVAKEEPDGLGSIAEDDVLAGRFKMSKDERINDKEAERVLLTATTEEMLRHEVCLREQASDGPHLVFPSQLTREHPDLPDPQGKAVILSFEGPVQNIYATLIVRLSHSRFFRKNEMWKNATTFSAVTGGTCGIYLREVDEGRAELTLFYDTKATRDARLYFEDYISSHLLRRALPETISRRAVIVCNDCGFLVTEQLAKLRAQRGFDWTDCPGCGNRLSLREPYKPSGLDERSIIGDLDRAADHQRELDAGLVSAAGEMRTVGFRKWAGASRTTLVILFTDVLASTELVDRLGNEAMNKIRRSHFSRGRQLTEKYGGYLIKTIGDSLMLAFRTVVSGLDFALEFRADTGDENVRIRSAIHVGPVEIEENDAFGAMVNYAARVIGFADEAELWLSSLAKDHIEQERAARHSKLIWYEFPNCLLKGISGRHTLWSDTEARKKVLIIHSGKDHELAERLCLDFQSIGVHCLLAPECEIKTTAKNDPVDTPNAILNSYKLLLLLSKHSNQSTWIESLITEALIEENIRKRKKVLFPLRLDSSFIVEESRWAKKIKDDHRLVIRTAVLNLIRHVDDFEHWRDEQAYESSLRALRQSIL